MNAGSRVRSTAAAAIFAAVLSSGCALLGGPSDAPGDETLPDPDLVAQDLVYTLAQVPQLHPLKTTLQVSEPLTPFGQRVLARLGEAGYGLQRVETDQGPNFVRYRTEHVASETGERTRYRLAVGEVSIERDYEAGEDGATVPESVQLVRGVPERSLAINEDVFGAVSAQGLSRIAYEEDTQPVIRDLSLGAAHADTVPPTPVEGPTSEADGVPVTFGTAVKRNMYETLRSNYADVFADYEDVLSDVLVFPNDSLRLGEKNKRTIARYVGELDPATDVLSVIGCSHGNTAINNGNELLAIGRSNRVKEAFLFAGIDHEQVLEEACWAPVHFDKMPRRGVVVTLKRRRDLG